MINKNIQESEMANKNIETNKEIKEVILHATKMRVAIDHTRAKCVDGGYRNNEAVGAIAIPGAHLGISMTLLSLDFSPDESFEIVYNCSSKSNNPYCWHTDNHEGQDGVIIGCGHCNASMIYSEFYKIEKTKVSELLKIIKKAQKSKPNMEFIILNRDHVEKGILIITSTDFTVKPWDEELGIQYFIYDKVNHMNLLKEIVEFAKTLGKEISFEELLEITEKQTNSTLGLLGSSKGKSIFTVDVSNEKPVVEYIGKAPILK